jgi:hypothetical protein
MELDKIMRQYGFSSSVHDGYYVKEINYDGEPAFIYITGSKVYGVPETLDEPILVMMYNSDFDEIRGPIEVVSLRTYIGSIEVGSVFYQQRFEEGCGFPTMLERSSYTGLCRCLVLPGIGCPKSEHNNPTTRV